ncbi:MAG: hypothetical protein IPN71_06155 [Fibrobacteres bacterium]|nr:hypothetical protein [Fibrobacterota bacterium]
MAEIRIFQHPVRGAPLSGGKYDGFPFPQKEAFFWRAKQLGEMPIGFGEIDIAFKLIGGRETAK